MTKYRSFNNRYDDYDGYYDDGYNYRSSWSWGNFGSSFQQEDDDNNLSIKPNEGYFTPKSDEIKRKIDRSCNSEENIKLIKEMSRFFYYRMLDEKDYFDEKFKDLSLLSEEEVNEFNTKKKFYEDLWDKYVPGYSPLEQAISIFNELVKDKKGSKNPVIQIETLDKKGLEIKFDEDTIKDPILNELLDTNMFGTKFKSDILNKISLIKNLGSEFKIQKEIEEKIVPNSQIIAKKLMNDFSQIYNVDLYQRLLPNFDIKLLTKDLVVNVPVDRTDHKQKIIILVDYSGSMREDEKQKWVVALLVDRLKYCIKGECEVFFSYFVNDTSTLNFTHIYDRKTAIEFWTTFSTMPNGGDTQLGDMVNYIKDQIENKHQLCNLNVDLSKEKVEILSVNDGQDTIKTNNFTYKTNAISLMDCDNKELRELCLKNKGKYVFIDNNQITTYNEQSKQIIKN